MIRNTLLALSLVALSSASVATDPPAAPGPIELYRQYARAQLAALGFERHETVWGDETLVWWSAGVGPTTILVHGVSDHAGTWFQVVADLITDRRVVLVDLPGHGESTPKTGPLPMTTILEGFESWMLTALADEKEPATLIGNSMGAWVAMLVAHRHPDRVARVVAINGGPLKPDTGNLNLLPQTREEARRLMAALRDPASPAIPDMVLDDLVARVPDGQVARMFEANEDLEGYLLDDRLAEIETPVDLLWGAADRYLGEDFPQRLLDGLPRVRITRIDHCGHSPQAECPDEFQTQLSAVLAMDPPGSPLPSDPAPTPE